MKFQYRAPLCVSNNKILDLEIAVQLVESYDSVESFLLRFCAQSQWMDKVVWQNKSYEITN